MRINRGIHGLGATPAQLASAMAAVESGGSFSSISVRNNNPLNLVYVGQPGAVLGEGGFAKFSSYDAGLQAGLSQINLNVTRGTSANGLPTRTLSELIANSWSPATALGNSVEATASYVQRVAVATGIDPNADLSSQLTSQYSSPIELQQAIDGLDSSNYLPTLTEGSTGLFLGVALMAGALVWALSE